MHAFSLPRRNRNGVVVVLYLLPLIVDVMFDLTVVLIMGPNGPKNQNKAFIIEKIMSRTFAGLGSAQAILHKSKGHIHFKKRMTHTDKMVTINASILHEKIGIFYFTWTFKRMHSQNKK